MSDMAYASPRSPQRRGPHPAVLAVCIVIGVLLLLAGPGSCALSCYTAPRAVASAMEVCNEGATQECLDRFTDKELATGLGEVLPIMAERCGTAPQFATSGINVSIDTPLDMTAEIRGNLVAGDCPFKESVVKLEGHALRWRIVKIDVQ